MIAPIANPHAGILARAFLIQYTNVILIPELLSPMIKEIPLDTEITNVRLINSEAPLTNSETNSSWLILLITATITEPIKNTIENSSKYQSPRYVNPAVPSKCPINGTCSPNHEAGAFTTSYIV